MASREQVREIYHIAWLLRQKLVPDLIPEILEHAKLFCHHKSTADRYTVIKASNSGATLLVSDTIQSERPKAVRMVSFKITSKDQGYIAYPGRGQWTWFTAGILKTGGDSIDCERKIFCNNPHDNGFVHHQIEWSVNSRDPDEAEWVRQLQHGDRIIVRGHSKFHGWVNFVKFVEVTVCTRVVR